MPHAAFAAPDGTIGTLKKFHGKPLLVNFWATWCSPCIQEMPTLERLAVREGEQLKVLTVSQDSKGAEVVKPWFAKNRYTYLEAYTDPEASLGRAAGVEMLPTTILYDAQGKEVWRIMGGMKWDGPEAVKLLAEASVG